MRHFNLHRNTAFRRMVTGILTLGIALNAVANPLGMTVQRGAARATVNGSQLTVTASRNAFLNWQSFNIAAGETTVFRQPSAASIVWNRINDQNPSQIYGSLRANGVVVLLNSSGFYFGPNSFVSAAGLVVSTANCLPPQNSGGSWEFNGPPPLASIVNYGQIKIGAGGSAFLIADKVENHGSIAAPGGTVGLVAGQTVLLSERPDGRGLSMKVTLPGGSVDNEGRLIADGGSIAMKAQVVNQNGFLQADSVRNQNGIIELVASDQLSLGANSQIVANGDNSPAGSPGGNVTLQSGNIFSDSVGSQIIVTGGAHGGSGGNVEISAPNVRSLNSGINARAQAGGMAGQLLLDPDYIVLDTSGSDSAGSGTVLAEDNAGSTLDLNVNSAFANLAVSKIVLQAVYDITLAGGTVWNLGGTIGANLGGVTGGQLTLEAGRDILFGDGSQITDANQWSVALQAGYNFANNTIQSGVGNIYLNGGNGLTGIGSIQLSKAAINLTAGNSIVVGSGCQLINDGGFIGLYAPTVEQNGLIQANSVVNQHGIIELVAANSLALGANSQIFANGDNSPAGSAGGQVMLQTAQNFSDVSGSQIEFKGGANGGSGGKALIYAAQSSVNSTLNGAAAPSATGNIFYYPRVDDLTLTAGSLAPFAGFSRILFQANDDITLALAAVLNLGAGTPGSQITLEAGNNIIFNNNSRLQAAAGWSVGLFAGVDFTSPALSVVPVPVGNTDSSINHSIFLNGNSGDDTGGGSIQTADGDINLVAGQDILVGDKFVHTTGGGSITAIAMAGSVNTGSAKFGYATSPSSSTLVVDIQHGGTGGISSEAGGDVSITAGKDIISFLPDNGDNNVLNDAGSGAFGPGNVKLIAGGNVEGHFVVANGTGIISAGNNAGLTSGDANADGSVPRELALSLATGGWTVTAANDINLQEVRNPNGIFYTANSSSPTYHNFNYAADAFVNLAAGNAVQLGDAASLPRASDEDIPIIYPPILNVSAGAGGVNINGGADPYNKLILFPSPLGSLIINTTGGGSLSASVPANDDGSSGVFKLIVSDSALTQFNVNINSDTFGLTDISPSPIHQGSSTPMELNISGDMNNVLFGAPEAAQINVVGDMVNSRFQGENLSSDPNQSVPVQVREIDGSLGTATVHPGLTSIDVGQSAKANMENSGLLDPATDSGLHVGGDIKNRSEFTTVPVATPPSLSFLDQASPASPLAGHIFYDSATKQLTFGGPITDQILNALADLTYQTVDAKGKPSFDKQGNPITAQVNLLDPGTALGTLGPNALALQAEYALLGNVQTSPDSGYLLGGGGLFNINAHNMNLGSTLGIVSAGPGFNPALNSGPGAAINVNLAGNLDMVSTTISALSGGNIAVTAGGAVNVGSSVFIGNSSNPRGIFTSEKSDVTVIANGDINVNGSRIAAYGGGNVTVRSLNGDVNAGSGGSGFVTVQAFSVDPNTHAVTADSATIPGSGILATTFPDSKLTVGNILVETPNGSVNASAGGIVQLALNKVDSKNSTVTVLAGEDADGNILSPDRNIDASGSGVIGSTVILKASGNIIGAIFARDNLDIKAVQNVSVTALSEGTANVGAGGNISGTIIGVGGITASGGSVEASLLSNNSISGATSGQTGLGQGTAANAASQSMATEDATKAVASTDDTDDLKKKGKGIALTQKTGRVTVILPPKNKAETTSTLQRTENSQPSTLNQEPL